MAMTVMDSPPSLRRASQILFPSFHTVNSYKATPSKLYYNTKRVAEVQSNPLHLYLEYNLLKAG